MEICVLLEGSYPYIAGGVSSWIHFLISELKETKFKIVSIMPSRQEDINYKYQIPNNVKEVKTIYLDDFKKSDSNFFKRKPKLNKQEFKEIKKFYQFNEDVNWNVIAKIICDPHKTGDVKDFLQSKVFWDILLEFYQQRFINEGFNRFFWTVKSMFLFVMSIMRSKLPKADIYHAVSTGYAGLLGLLAKLRFNEPFILTEHGIYAREREGEIIKATWVEGAYKQIWIDFFYFLSTGVYKHADKIISLFARNQNIQQELGAAQRN